MRAAILRRLFPRQSSKPIQHPRLSSTMSTDPSVDQEQQEEVPHFTFSEEPLGLPASEGYGYFQGGPGMSLGPDNRFLLQAKLGFGTASSVWLARDLT